MVYHCNTGFGKNKCQHTQLQLFLMGSHAAHSGPFYFPHLQGSLLCPWQLLQAHPGMTLTSRCDYWYAYSALTVLARQIANFSQ